MNLIHGIDEKKNREHLLISHHQPPPHPLVLFAYADTGLQQSPLVVCISLSVLNVPWVCPNHSLTCIIRVVAMDCLFMELVST